MIESRSRYGAGGSDPHCRSSQPLFETHAVLDRAVVDDETQQVIGSIGDSDN